VVGSSRTRIQAGRMVTPRDYRWALEPQDNVSEVVP
jgi:precorrin-3B methylase